MLLWLEPQLWSENFRCRSAAGMGMGSEDTPSCRLLLAEVGRLPGRLGLVVLCASRPGVVLPGPGLDLDSSGGGCGTSAAADTGIKCGNSEHGSN